MTDQFLEIANAIEKGKDPKNIIDREKEREKKEGLTRLQEGMKFVGFSQKEGKK